MLLVRVKPKCVLWVYVQLKKQTASKCNVLFKNTFAEFQKRILSIFADNMGACILRDLAYLHKCDSSIHTWRSRESASSSPPLQSVDYRQLSDTLCDKRDHTPGSCRGESLCALGIACILSKEHKGCQTAPPPSINR